MWFVWYDNYRTAKKLLQPFLIRSELTMQEEQTDRHSITRDSSVLLNSDILQSIRYAYDKDALGEWGVLVGPFAVPHREGSRHWAATTSPRSSWMGILLTVSRERANAHSTIENQKGV
jgi:hypothetical protein